MKIAEALLKRKQKKSGLDQIVQKIQESASYIGDQPDYDARHEMQRLVEEANNIAALIVSINTINSNTFIQYGDDTLSLMEAIARRDTLKEAAAKLNSVHVKTGADYDGKRYTVILKQSEIRTVANQLARQARELDVLLQEANWTNELDQ